MAVDGLSVLTCSSSGDRSSMSSRHNVLFLCSNNGTSSLMAERLLHRWAGDEFKVFSAGWRPCLEPHPATVAVLQAQGLWDRSLRCKSYEEFQRDGSPRLDFVITLGERVLSEWPGNWHGNPRLTHWRISEPVAPSHKRTLQSFTRTFAELQTRVRLFALVHQRKASKRARAA